MNLHVQSPIRAGLGPLGRPAGGRLLGGRQRVVRQAPGDEPLQALVADLELELEGWCHGEFSMVEIVIVQLMNKEIDR